MKTRIFYLVIGMIVFIISYFFGANTNINLDESKIIREQFEEKIKGIDQFGIFLNNIIIALGMFIPGLGIGLGIFSGFGTGLVFSAIAENNVTLQNISPLAILVTPFGILEIFSYGLAISRSAMIVHDYFIKKIPWNQFFKPTVIEIIIVVSLLLIGAVIEWNMIEQFTKGPS